MEKSELECDVPLKPLQLTAFGRMKQGSGPFQDVTIELPVKEGELEIEVYEHTMDTFPYKNLNENVPISTIILFTGECIK